VATRAEPGPRGGSGEMFDRIAHRYDLLNRLLSLGADQGWRRATAEALSPEPGQRILDLATGTGDLAFSVLRSQPAATVVGLDESPRMLERARAKAGHAGLGDRVRWVVGHAEALPFEDHSFDAVCIAFGIRNVPDPGRALAEMARVTRPRGRVAILELSDPDSGPLRHLARLHVHRLVPWLGGWLSGIREYRYLSDSIAAFPRAAAFAQLMARSGLDVLEIRRLCFSAAHLYLGRPRRSS
jgi:demethylmenaquinone methyltransferase/2-methoxy-6-polyprenyl-1,4-benzoquinol methylase